MSPHQTARVADEEALAQARREAAARRAEHAAKEAEAREKARQTAESGFVAARNASDGLVSNPSWRVALR